MSWARKVLSGGLCSSLVLVLCLATGSVTYAAGAPAPAVPSTLAIAQIKMTGDEFVIIENNSGHDIPDLSTYWLYEYNNFNPQAAGASSSTQQLPAASLAQGRTLLLSSAARNTCGAEVAGNLDVSLGDSNGSLEILGSSNGLIASTPTDFVSWNSHADGLIQNVPSNSKDPGAAWYRYRTSDDFGWQQADIDAANDCQLAVTIAGAANPISTNPGNQLLAGTPPPVTVVSTGSTNTASSAALPSADVGLMAPELNELLPNPASPSTDADDEYVELYNPNAASFDLSGFTLQTASTTSKTTHTYTFPDGTMLPPKSFTVFRSRQTGLEMSNSGGQVWLLDPFGNTIGQSDPYGAAKDGQAWAYANSSWEWTTTPTPNTANVINVPVNASSSKSKSSGKASAKTAGKASGTATSADVNGNNSSNVSDTLATPIHPLVLAGVAALALLYGLYEYRHDLANKIYERRRHRAARRAARQPLNRRRVHRAAQ